MFALLLGGEPDGIAWSRANLRQRIGIDISVVETLRLPCGYSE